MDVCDKVKQFELQKEFPELKKCNFYKKIIPLMPNGEYAKVEDLPFYFEQKE
jgi:hypothetical protein